MRRVPGELPDHLPGEPPIPQPGRARRWGTLAARGLALAGGSLLALPCWPIYLALRLLRHRPPTLPTTARVLRYLRLLLAPQSPAAWLAPSMRAGLVLTLLRRWAMTPLGGLAWYLDDLYYGRQLAALTIEAPLFEISASRSGSTQLAHYLEDDPQICAPNMLQLAFPYLWLWRLAPATFGRLISRERVQRLVSSRFHSAFLERHEVDAFRTDTFEINAYLHHLSDIACHFGPDFLLADYSHSRLASQNRPFWQGEFLRLVDGIGRKVLLAQPARPGQPRPRLLIKGHFLAVAAELAQRYPDARFLTVLREPDKRLQSVINFQRSWPPDLLVGYLPWDWIVHFNLAMETEYCVEEMAWYQQAGSPRRCVIRFTEYVEDLEGTMRRVYQECLDQDQLPPHVPTRHAPRVRHAYSFDRSLAQLQIDVVGLRQRLAAYYAWCASPAPPQTQPPQTDNP